MQRFFEAKGGHGLDGKIRPWTLNLNPLKSSECLRLALGMALLGGKRWTNSLSSGATVCQRETEVGGNLQDSGLASA